MNAPEDRFDVIAAEVDEGLACLLGSDDVTWLVNEIRRLRAMAMEMRTANRNLEHAVDLATKEIASLRRVLAS